MNYEENVGPIIVTGGAGFIGSHVVETLLNFDVEVKVLDNFSSGTIENLSKSKDNKRFQFMKINLGSSELDNQFTENIKTVFHIAAYPEVRTGFDSPKLAYDNNIWATFNLLETIRKSNVQKILFTSSSTVYGEPEKIPTSEDYGPLIPISHYGASKLACEALISSYCHTYGIKGVIFRLANIIGSRSNHGVILDFIEKLRKDGSRLLVLGDGKQTKSYLHINDCVAGLLKGFSKSIKEVEVFNLGNFDWIDVISIAKTVSMSMSLDNAEILTTGGVDEGRGWIGDVKKMHLDISKLKAQGWLPKYSSAEAVTKVVNELVKKIQEKQFGN